MKFAGHAMEILFDLLRRRGGAKAEQFVVSGFASEVEQRADFFFKFFGVERVFGDGGGLGFRFGDGRRLFRDRCRGRHRRMLGGLLGCRLGMSRAGRCLHADDRTENEQSIDRAAGGFLGHRTVGEEKIGGDGMRNGCEEAALDMIEFDCLVAQQRVG